MLVCEVYYAARPGQRPAVMALAAAMVRETRKEPGNLAYAHHPSLDDEVGMFVFEAWASEEALRAHNRMPHFQTFLRQVRPLLQEDAYRYRIHEARLMREGVQPLNLGGCRACKSSATNRPQRPISHRLFAQ